MGLVWRTLIFIALIELGAGTPGNCQAGGAGYALSFDAPQGMTVSMQWQTAPLSQVTFEYWFNLLDPHLSQPCIFAYSVLSATGRYNRGGPIYESSNELV